MPIVAVSFQEYTCPLCASGFIEELPPNSQRQNRSTSVSDDMESSNDSDPRQLNERLSSILMSSLGGAQVQFLVDDDPSNQEGSTSSEWLLLIFHITRTVSDGVFFLFIVLVRFFAIYSRPSKT